MQSLCILSSYCVIEIARCKFSLVILFIRWGKISLLNVSCNCTCFAKLESWSFLNSSFHYLNIRLFFSYGVCSVSWLEFALFYSICIPCIFQALFWKQMMYFSIKKHNKNKQERSKQRALNLMLTVQMFLRCFRSFKDTDELFWLFSDSKIHVIILGKNIKRL